MTKFRQRSIIGALLLTLSLLCTQRVWTQQAGKAATAAEIEERMKKDITYLASDECEGRGPGTKGIDLAADYIAAQFAKSGLKPAVKGSYFQPFTIGGAGAKLEDGSSLVLRGPDDQKMELKLGEDYQVMGFSGSGKVSAPLVFVGHGVTAPGIGYDDFKGLDVAGKFVVLIRRVPRWTDSAKPFDGANKENHASLETKITLAEKHKAAAVILVNDQSESGEKLLPFSYAAGAAAAVIPVVNASRNAMDKVFKSVLGKNLGEIEKAIDADLKPMGAPLKGWSASVQCDIKRSSVIAVKNVIGVLEGSGPLADETVVVGAHYDHLGYGGVGSLAGLPKDKKEIHHGADDNASGSTSVMELTRRFGAMPKREGRRIVFITFSGEERGLLGSRYYCNKDPIFPLEKTVAMVNLDMVGRLPMDPETKKGKLIVEGLGTAKGFPQLIDKLNEGQFNLIKRQPGTGPSDHDSFYRQKIPVLFFWNNTHKDYHRPSDTSDKINVPGMKSIADLAEKVITELATDPKRPEYMLVKADPTVPPKKMGPKLGVVPDYDEAVKGLRIADVAVDGPAAKAGLKGGDIIVEIGGQEVKGINGYMVLMSKQKVGEAVEIGVMRDGKKLTLKAIPQ